jgi:hypothetical protein
MIKNIIEYFYTIFHYILYNKITDLKKSEKSKINIQNQEKIIYNKKRKFYENVENTENKINKKPKISNLVEIRINIQIPIEEKNLQNNYILTDYINNYQGIEV